MFVDTPTNSKILNHAWVNLAVGLGTAFFAAGILGMLTSNSSRDLFENSTGTIFKQIVNQSHESLRQILSDFLTFLKGLNKEKLDEFQRAIFELRKGHPVSDLPNPSLYDYYDAEMLEHLKSPWRKGVSSDITITEEDGRLIAIDELVYTCCKGAGGFQETIEYGLKEDAAEPTGLSEYKELVSCEVKVVVAGREEPVYCTLHKKGIVPIMVEEAILSRHPTLRNLGQFRIKMIVKYRLSKDVFQTWPLSYPTQGAFFGLKIAADKLPGYRVVCDVFGKHDPADAIRYTDDRRGCTFETTAWMLPQNGFAYRVFMPSFGTGGVGATSANQPAEASEPIRGSHTPESQS